MTPENADAGVVSDSRNTMNNLLGRIFHFAFPNPPVQPVPLWLLKLKT
jgi:hypothetical protein